MAVWTKEVVLGMADAVRCWTHSKTQMIAFPAEMDVLQEKENKRSSIVQSLVEMRSAL